MKNLMKTASAQNFAGFIRKFESMNNDEIPEFDFSRDLQELGENVEQQKTEVEPLSQETIDFVVNFIEIHGKHTNQGRIGDIYELVFQHNGTRKITMYKSRMGISFRFGLPDEPKRYVGDAVPTLTIDGKGRVDVFDDDWYAKESIAQQKVNDIFTNLTLQY